MTTEIDTLFKKLLEEKTFSLEAIDGIKKLRDETSSLQNQVQRNLEQIETMKKEKSEISTSLETFRTREATLNDRERKVTEREVKMTELEKGTAVAAAKFEVLDNFTSRLLANRIIRESVNMNVPIPIPSSNNGGGGYVGSGTESGQRTTEEG